MSDSRHAVFLALDVTTTEFALAVRAIDGSEDYVATPMRGGHAWRDDPAFPAFDLAEIPGMLLDLLKSLQARGWCFQENPEVQRRCLSVSCRQHDQVLLDRRGTPLMPAISWQCNAATEEVQALKELAVEKTVGTIEPRFVLPKLRCVMRHDPSLKKKIGTVFMTGDWIAYELTGVRSISTSDALSNGLLDQSNRHRADGVLQAAGFDVGWFPEPVLSGAVVGTVQSPTGESTDPWYAIQVLLRDWEFAAGLGDNHASAVGCGMTDDYRTLVVSGGTSGTINLSCPATAKLPSTGQSLRFEFYEDSLLLLLMLGDCGAWYNRFLDPFARGYGHCLDYLNQQALTSDLTTLRRVLHCDVDHTETFAPSWADASLGQKVAATQFSIVLELLLRVKQMLGEVQDANVPEIETFVLTGGLSQSRFFQHVFHAGVQVLAPGNAVKVSGRTGPLRYKTSAYGTLINAELPMHDGRLADVHASGHRFPLIDCAVADAAGHATLHYLLRSYGL
ncbi:MAG: FGGY family carbohydrate kinase [Pirellulaceae bacterium]